MRYPVTPKLLRSDTLLRGDIVFDYNFSEAETHNIDFTIANAIIKSRDSFVNSTITNVPFYIRDIWNSLNSWQSSNGNNFAGATRGFFDNKKIKTLIQFSDNENIRTDIISFQQKVIMVSYPKMLRIPFTNEAIQANSGVTTNNSENRVTNIIDYQVRCISNKINNTISLLLTGGTPDINPLWGLDIYPNYEI